MVDKIAYIIIIYNAILLLLVVGNILFTKSKKLKERVFPSVIILVVIGNIILLNYRMPVNKLMDIDKSMVIEIERVDLFRYPEESLSLVPDRFEAKELINLLAEKKVHILPFMTTNRIDQESGVFLTIFTNKRNYEVQIVNDEFVKVDKAWYKIDTPLVSEIIKEFEFTQMNINVD